MKNAEKIKEVYTELQSSILKKLGETYGEVPAMLARIQRPQIVMPNMFKTKEELQIEITELLVSVIDTLADGSLDKYDLSDIVYTEFYDTLIVPHIDRITTSLMFAMSDYTLGLLTYYMDKYFIWNWLKTTIVRPNIISILDTIRARRQTKDNLDKKIETSQFLTEKVTRTCEYLLIELNGDEFINGIKEINKIEIENKQNIIRETISSMKLAVPEFVIEILTSGIASDVNISKCKMFLQEYLITHTINSVTQLFYKYCNTSVSREELNTLIENTLKFRNSAQLVNDIICVDGLTFAENKLADKIIHQMDEEKDEALINANAMLKAIKSIIKVHKTYNSTASLNNTDVVITRNGKSFNYNFRKKDVYKEINDPFAVFSKPNFVRTRYNQTPEKCCLMQTGMTEKEANDMFAAGTLQKFTDLPMVNKILNRRDKIKKLLAKFAKDTELMKEYERLTTQRITKPKYISILQSTPYRIADEKRLLLTLAETEALYTQITSDVQATEDVMETTEKNNNRK